MLKSSTLNLPCAGLAPPPIFTPLYEIITETLPGMITSRKEPHLAPAAMRLIRRYYLIGSGFFH